MTWLVAALSLAIAAVAAVAAVVARRRASRFADRVAREIEPYLRRKAAEAGLEVLTPVWTPRHDDGERIDYSAGLAQQLIERERHSAPESSSTALAQTVPADPAVTTAPQSPRAKAE